MVLVVSVSDGERSQTGQVHGEMGELAWARHALTGRQLQVCWCPRGEAAPASLCDGTLQGQVPIWGHPQHGDTPGRWMMWLGVGTGHRWGAEG